MIDWQSFIEPIVIAVAFLVALLFVISLYDRHF